MKKGSQQTDFGNIFFSTPAAVYQPKTLEELADILKEHHEKNTPVTIQNSGGSLRGQSLTHSVQVNVSRLSWVVFDKQALVVTAGAGALCHDIWQATEFPSYSLPVFTAFPGQKVSIGGVLAAGGMGYYSITNGGLWDWVESLKIVTMKGEIIECTKHHNIEYLQYSLGGYGRIGVIGEVSLKVVPSKENVSVLSLAYFSRKRFFKDLCKLPEDMQITGMTFGQGTLSFRWLPWLKIPYYVLMLFSEKVSNISKQKMRYGGFFSSHKNEFFRNDNGACSSVLTKKNLVYYLPKLHRDSDRVYPWINIAIGVHDFSRLFKKVNDVLKKYNLQHSMMYDTLPRWGVRAHFRFFGEAIKNLSQETGLSFPLVPLSHKESYTFGSGIFFSVDRTELPVVQKATKEILQIVYAMNGKQYIFSHVEMTRQQIEQQYSKKVIQKWNRIKKELDPKGLLNPGVLEHLDSFSDGIE